MINIKPIFATIYSADFYPKGKPNKIQITVDAQKRYEQFKNGKGALQCSDEVALLITELKEQLTATQQALDEAKDSLTHMMGVAQIRREQLAIAVEALKSIKHRAKKHVSMEDDGYDLILRMAEAALTSISKEQSC